MSDFSCISDVYKDAYGSRPSSDWMRNFNALPYAEQKAEWDYLCDRIVREIELQRDQETQAYVRFLTEIAGIMANSTATYNDAVRWYVDSLGISDEDVQFYGSSYVCFRIGLGYDKAAELAEALGCRVQ
jgi:hypothetical protein